MQPTDSLYTELHKAIRELREELETIWGSFPKLPPVVSTLALSTVPTQLHRNKRRYSFIFFPRPANLIIRVPGLGQVPLTLEAGWLELSMPDGTEIALTSGSLTAIYRCMDTLG